MTHETVLVDLGRDFSRTPGGRYRADGQASAEDFRERLCEPVLDRGEHLTVDLDGPIGLGSSFMEEAFGGLVRRYGLERFTALVTIRSESRPERARRALELAARAASGSGVGAGP